MGTRDKSVGWYANSLKTITSEQRDLLENYSHVAPKDILTHIHKLVSHLHLNFKYQSCILIKYIKRDQAWEIYPYPCIGQFRFIDLSMIHTPSYESILTRLKSGGSLLDIGCCCAQDLRKLAHDGVPAAHLYGAELQQGFINLGYDLFRDKDQFGAHFMVADVFDKDGELKNLVGKMDVVHLGLFLHLFNWEKQVEACATVVGLLKREKGVIVIGQQIGMLEAGEEARGGNRMIFKHNVESFKRMWAEIGQKTQSLWDVKASLDHGLGIGDEKRKWDNPSSRRLVFEVERVG